MIRRSRGSRGTKQQFPSLMVALTVSALMITACGSGPPAGTSSAPKQEPSDQTVPWAEAPTDGQWPTSAYDRVPFGQLTPVPQGGPFTEFQFAVSGPPQLTTKDGGKNVTIASKVTVQRVEDKGFDKGIAKSQSFLFEPGTIAPENQMDESHGTHTTVACANDQPAVGETTTCDLSFTAPSSEIRDSYWTISGSDVGTWPSQR